MSVKGRTESESSWAGVTRGCSWQRVLCSVPGWEGHPHPGRVLLWKVANFSPGDSPKVSASLGSLPNGTPLPGRKPVCNPGFKRCFGVSWQKAAGDPNSKYRSKPIFFCNECKTSVPRSSLGNRSFCQRSVNITPKFLSSEVTSWLWSFLECSHGYLLEVNSSMLLRCWKATLRASGKSQAWGCSSSRDGPSPSQVMGSSFRRKAQREAHLPPAPWAEQLGRAGEPGPCLSPAPWGVTQAVGNYWWHKEVSWGWKAVVVP